MSGRNQAQNLALAFEIISRSRYSERAFSNKPVSDSVLRKVLELTQMAPSSFNLQPYKLLVVKSEEARSVLGKCMLGGNAARVETAPVTVIFAADKSMLDADIALSLVPLTFCYQLTYNAYTTGSITSHE